MTDNKIYRIGAIPKTVANILLQGRFQVPWHQREFDWDPDEVQEFWDDIVEAVRKQSQDYFIGSIVLTQRGKENYQIQDGQQRLVTYSLMCAALRRTFEKHHDPNTDIRIQEANKILYALSPTGMTSQDEVRQTPPRIKPSQKNDLNYRLIIMGRNLEPNGKLKKAWQILNQHSSKLNEEEAHKILEYLMKNVIAVEITTAPDNATQVFETLNDRGKHLEEVDLLRNHLYSHFGTDNDERHQQVHQNLVDLRDQFDGRYAVNKMAEYVRCYMQCRYGFINAKQLNKKTAEAVAEETQGFSEEHKKEHVADLVFDLRKRDHIEAFLALDRADTNSEIVNEFVLRSGTAQQKRNMRDFITELKDYKVTRPIMFAILTQFQNAQASEKRDKARYGHAIMANVTAFMMRTSAAMDKFSPTTVEEMLSTWGKRVQDELTNNTLEMFTTELKTLDKSRIWTNEDFMVTLGNLRLGHAKAKKILYPLYKYEQNDLSQQNYQQLTVEHILPESSKWIAGWSNFDLETHASYNTRLGNLTLMATSDNNGGEEENKSFDKKKQLLGRSTFTENQKIAALDTWSPRTIAARQDDLIKLACRVWPTSDK